MYWQEVEMISKLFGLILVILLTCAARMSAFHPDGNSIERQQLDYNRAVQSPAIKSVPHLDPFLSIFSKW